MSSSQQIPSAAQLSAARLAHWRQRSATAETTQPAEDAKQQPAAATAAPASESAGDDASQPQQASQPDAANEGDERSDPGQAGAANDAEDADEAAEDDASPRAHAGHEDDESDDEPERGTGEEPAEDAAATPSLASGGSASSAILTVEAAREFLNRAGLLLFAPRPQLGGPAPSFVEATLGRSAAAPTLAETETARTLAARLVAEGSAVPLNLLGAPGTTAETPDFLASVAVFPYLFTLRGDKAWKQLPSAEGAFKVSPLSVNTYAMLLEGGPKSAYALTGDLGKGLTEAAVLRALSELWQQLRVVPVAQTNGRPTLWEPIASRFQRQIKAGANAGQPTALSALITLYLGQSLMATGDEIEGFLSPLAPRSRVRDVVHALLAAQELGEGVIDGKQHLYVAGDLPEFGADAVAARTSERPSQSTPPAFAEDGGRIRKFVGKPAAAAANRSRPFRAPAGGGDRGAGRPSRPLRSGPAFGRAGDGPRRAPAAGNGPGGAERGRFSRPWDEEKQARQERSATRPPASGEEPVAYRDLDLDAAAGGGPAEHSPRPTPRSAPRSFGDRPSGDRGSAGKPRFGGDRPAFGRPRPGAEGRPPFRRQPDDDARPRRFDGPGRPDRPDWNDRPDRRAGFAARPPRRDGGDSETRPPRKSFGDRPSFGAKPSFGSKPSFGAKPGFGGKPGFGAKPGGFGGKPSFGDRPAFGSKPSFGGKPGRKSAFGGKPGFPARPDDRERRPFRRDPEDGEARAPRRPFNAEGDAPRPPRPSFADRAGAGDRPAFRKFDAPRGPRKPFPPQDGASGGGGGFDRPARKPFSPREGAGRPDRRSIDGGSRGASGGPAPFARRPAGDRKPFAGGSRGSFAGADRPSRKPAGAPEGGGGPFDKFKGGAKPWGKRRPPARKIKPEDQA